MLNQQLHAAEYAIEPDASAASYAFALAAATGGTVTVPNLNKKLFKAMSPLLKSSTMGAITYQNRAITVTGPNDGLNAVDVDMEHVSDTVMTLAAIAPLAEGTTTIRNVGNMRIKETDRLAACVNELTRCGQEVNQARIGSITPQPIQPAEIECYADHRMAMSFAILGCCAEGITITIDLCF